MTPAKTAIFKTEERRQIGLENGDFCDLHLAQMEIARTAFFKIGERRQIDRKNGDFCTSHVAHVSACQVSHLTASILAGIAQRSPLSSGQASSASLLQPRRSNFAMIAHHARLQLYLRFPSPALLEH